MCVYEYASLWLKRLCRNLFCTPCSVHSSDGARSSSFDGNLQPKFNETLGTCSLAEVIGSVLSLQTKSKIGKQRKWENHWKGKTPFNKEESTIQAVTMASNHCVILNNFSHAEDINGQILQGRAGRTKLESHAYPESHSFLSWATLSFYECRNVEYLADLKVSWI